MINKTDVLFLCQYFYPEKNSSAILPFELASCCANSGRQVEVLTGYPKEYFEGNVSKKETIDNVSINRVNYFQADRKHKLGRIINYFSFCLSILLKIKVIRRSKCCIVYSNPPLLPIIPALFQKKKSKLIYVMFDVYPDVAINFNVFGDKSLVTKLFNFFNKKIYKKCDKIVALSEEMREYLHLKKGIPKDKLEVIPNWYNSKQSYDLLEFQKSDKIEVLYGGNMGICQDMETLIEAIITLNNDPFFEFIFAGHGTKKDYVKEKLEMASIHNYKMYGFLEKKEYEILMNRADIMVVTLEPAAKGLGAPSKYYSYLFAGKMILAIMPNDTDITRDINKYKIGVNIDCGDVEELVNLFLSLKEKRNEIILCGKRAKELFEKKYTLEKCTDKYIKMIDSLIND